ncbi:MAG: GDP-L-fucose synthase [Nitrospirota bacterium]
MKILLTGSNGMVGRNILEHRDSKLFTLVFPSSKELNLLNYGCVERYLKKITPDLIIHAAGIVGGIQANMKEPVRFFLKNLDMGRNIVWAARQCGVKKIINLGSSCMYPRNAANPLREEYLLQGELEPTNEGYALAKIATVRLCEYIARETEDFQYKTLIPCNLYGRWDKFNPAYSHLIAAVIKKIHDAKMQGEKEVIIWGDGTARREFLFAGDLADCVLNAICQFDSLPSLMNVGFGSDYSINEYYDAVAEIVGYTGTFIHDLSKPVGMKQKLVHIGRQNKWGWHARTSLREGLGASYSFFLDQMNQ